MASRGAKHLILLSRSGLQSNGAQETVDELATKGCEVKVLACDISQKDQLEKVLVECGESMPPIKGCIQAAMVLQVGISETSRNTFTNLFYRMGYSRT
jgi:short-subunit dehydrogenase